MLNALSSFLHMAAREWLVWGLLGAQSVIMLAVALLALGARGKRTIMAHHHRSASQVFYDRLGGALSSLMHAGEHVPMAAIRRQVESLLSVLPRGPVGAFLRWRAVHLVEPQAVEQKIALLVAEAEGYSSRLLDFAKVTSPLLGLAGTLLGLQEAFSQASVGKAAVEAGIATALDTTYGGILIAIGAFFTLRFLVDPALAGLEAELWEADLRLNEIYTRVGVLGSGWADGGRETLGAPARGYTSSEDPRRPSAEDELSWPFPMVFDDEPVDG